MARKIRATSKSPAKPKAKAAGQSAKGPLLNLTSGEREALLQSHHLRPATMKKIEAAGEEPVRLTKLELSQILTEIGWGLDFDPEKFGPLATLRGRVVELMEQDAPDAFGAEHLRDRAKTGTRADLYFQFQITLLNIMPPIWRRIQVPDGTLASLHVCIQAAFGWEDEHLHEFTIGGLRFGPLLPDGFVDFDSTAEDETKPRLSQLVPQSGKQACWMYWYDFGDDWHHGIIFEGCGPIVRGTKYPLCLEGARACPPEDIGGPWGYADYLEAIADPRHERHEELMEWIGPFDPEEFDAKKATSEMRKWWRQPPER